MPLRIPVEPPFDFELSLRFVCQPPQSAAHLGFVPFADHWHGREYRRLIHLASRPVLAIIKNNGTVDRPRIEATAVPAELSAAEREEFQRRVAHMLAAEVRLEEFYRVAGRDPILRALTERFHGLKLVRAPSLYECLVSTVLEQQLNFHFASTVKRRLLERFGVSLVHQGRTYWGYPPPRALARLQAADLRSLQISERKASYLIGVARAEVEGRLPAAAALGSPLQPLPEPIMERLLALRGIGRWTAEYALLRGLGYADALPADDVGLQKTIGALYGLRGYASALAIRRRWKPLAPWRGYATHYCWFTQWA